MSSDTFQLSWPGGMEVSDAAACRPIGEIVRIAEEGGQFPIDACRCQRCISAAVDAVVNTNFARRMLVDPAQPLASDAVPGIRIRLTPPLGRGGQGSVYFGVDPQTADCVAVKILARSRCDETAYVTRIFFEAMWLKQLATPGLVEFHSCGITRTGKPYLCTKYIEGPTLAQMLSEQRLLVLRPSERAVWALRVTAGILRPLDTLHQRGFVHCDLKPSNIIMRRGEDPVLLDLGIAAASGNPHATCDEAVFAGSRPYAAPERIRMGDQASEPTVDVYSLGIMLKELATAQMSAGAKPARLSPSLDAIIAKATDEDPRERFVDASEMLLAVNAAVRAYARNKLSPLRVSIAAFAIVTMIVAASTLSTLWVTSNRAGRDAKEPSATDPSALRTLPAFSARDVLAGFRTQWEKVGHPAPDLEHALQCFDDAKVYFGAIQPLSEWGYVGGATVGGQVTCVATRPLEIIHRAGRSRLTFLQPTTGITRTIERPKLMFARTTLSANHKWVLLYGMDGAFEVIDRASLETVDKGTHSFRTATVPVISDDGRFIARIDPDGAVWLRRDTGRWESLMTVPPAVNCLAFCKRHLIIITQTGDAISYDLDSRGITHQQVASPPFTPHRLSISDQGAVVVFTNGQTWASQDEGVNWNQISPYAQSRDAVAISPDRGDVITFSQGVGRSVEDGGPPAVHSGFSRVVHAAIAENRQVVVTHGRTWRLIDPGARPPWVQVSGDISTDMFAQRVNDARIFAGHLGIWRAAVDSNERTCLSASNTSNVCIDEPSDRLLASGYAGDIVMHSLASGEIKWTYQKEDLGTPVVALWKDVAFVGGSDSTVTALDAATGMIRWTRQDQRYRVRDISTAAGRVASASSSPGIVVYDMNGEQQALCRFVDARCVALSPDAEQFISGSDRGTIAVGTASSRAPTSEIPAHAGGVWSVAINPTGTLAASGGGDGIVRLWWLNPLTPIASFPISQEQSSLVLDVRFSEDSRRLSCSLISQGAYEIDLAQHEHALDDWLTRDLAYASSGHTVGSGTDTFSNDNDEGQ